MVNNSRSSNDLDDIDEDDRVEYLEDRGYLVEKEDLSSDDGNSAIDTVYNGQAKSVVRYINNNGEETLLKEVLYEYLGMGHFNDVDTLCEELKKRLS